MKKCNNCGTQVQDNDLYCPNCGSPDFSALPTMNGQPVDVNGQPIPMAPEYQPEPDNGIVDNGNVGMGIVGAALLSLAGVVLYFIIYQIGYVAGICGFVMFTLATLGYNKFAKPQTKNPMLGIIIAAVVTIVMLFVAEYISMAYALYDGFQELGYTQVGFFDVLKNMPDFLSDSEVMSGLVEDLSFAYVFAVANIAISIFSARKKAK